MEAVDETDRVRRQGWLTFTRSAPNTQDPDDPVVEELVITLRTPSDPTGKCVAEVKVLWAGRHGPLTPCLVADGSAAKMLALYPEVLVPFLAMDNGRITPEALIDGLLKVGVVQRGRGEPFVSPMVSCSRCRQMFANEDCATPDPLVRDETMCHLCAILSEADALKLIRERRTKAVSAG